MSERLVVDSFMTADGEVVQLPTLGPLGPVDAQGGRIPLDTVKLFDAEGRFLKVESYEFSIWSRSVGSMALTRRYDGQPIIALELDTAVALDISVNGGVGDCVSADVTATAYIEDIKYCPFCGEEL